MKGLQQQPVVTPSASKNMLLQVEGGDIVIQENQQD
jgi:hypothetical protein